MARPAEVAWALCAALALGGTLTVGGIASVTTWQGAQDGPAPAASPLPGEQTALPVAADHGAKPATISTAELDAFVAARSRTLQSHDRTAFLAAIDPKQVDVVTQQGHLYDNLQKVHFDAEDYAVHGTGSVESTFAGQAYATVDVDFEHRISGVDTAAVVERLRWTVRRSGPGGALRITAVGPTDGVSDSSSYYPAPWDVVPDLTVITRQHVVLMADDSSASYAARTADTAEQAAEFDLGHWSGGPGTAPGFSVFFTSDQSMYRKLYGVGDGRGWDVGMTIPIAPAASTQSTYPSSRIVMDTTSDKNGSDDVAITLRHEMSHAMVFPFQPLTGGGQDDRWLVEGFAEWMSYRVYSDPLVLQALANSGDVPSGTPTHLPADDEVYASDSKTAGQNYALAQLALMYMASKYGADKVDLFVATVYKADGTPGAVDVAMGSVLGTTTAEFAQGWAAYVRSHA
jgi:hypothetical protein